ncbi:MAG: hypothetical protein ABIR18_16400, partial [Chitinophagaceae bacterium]
QYDQFFVYLLPDGLTSFMRVGGFGATYSEKLNELISYKLVCIAYKGEQPFFFSKEDIKGGTHNIELKATGKNELDRQLKRSGTTNHAADILKENDFLRFEIKDKERQKNNESLRELMRKVMPIVFPCYGWEGGAPDYIESWYNMQ